MKNLRDFYDVALILILFTIAMLMFASQVDAELRQHLMIPDEVLGLIVPIDQ